MTTDPRFDAGHLEPPRRERYEEARDDLFDACGTLTTQFERLAAVELLQAVLCPTLPPDAPYALRDARTGCYFPLRVGLTAIGRLPENNIVLPDNPISRRHCVVLVHATGGCELHDTASRHGTWVNGRRIDRIWLVPGDVVRLCDWKFWVAARAAREEMIFRAFPAEESAEAPATTDFRQPVGSWCGG